MDTIYSHLSISNRDLDEIQTPVAELKFHFRDH